LAEAFCWPQAETIGNPGKNSTMPMNAIPHILVGFMLEFNVDTESLFALPDKIGCPGCVDEPVDWITVDYSDGTTKSVMCNSGDQATEMADKVKAALAEPSRTAPTQKP